MKTMQTLAANSVGNQNPRIGSRTVGMTLVEVLVAVTIFAVVFGSIVMGLAQTNYRASSARYTTSANKFAEQRLEQVLNAPWNTSVFPVVDQAILTNFPNDTVTLDDYGGGVGKTPLTATRSVGIVAMPSTSNPQYKVIQVKVAWTLKGRGASITLQSIRSPD